MVTSLVFSPDGEALASSGYDLFVKFWDIANGRLLGQVSLTDTPNFLAFSPGWKQTGSRIQFAGDLCWILSPCSLSGPSPRSVLRR